MNMKLFTVTVQTVTSNFSCKFEGLSHNFKYQPNCHCTNLEYILSSVNDSLSLKTVKKRGNAIKKIDGKTISHFLQVVGLKS